MYRAVLGYIDTLTVVEQIFRFIFHLILFEFSISVDYGKKIKNHVFEPNKASQMSKKNVVYLINDNHDEYRRRIKHLFRKRIKNQKCITDFDFLKYGCAFVLLARFKSIADDNKYI